MTVTGPYSTSFALSPPPDVAASLPLPVRPSAPPAPNAGSLENADLDLLLTALPPHVRQALGPLDAAGAGDLLEVIMDLGRPAEARYERREELLGEDEITAEDLAYVVARIGEFGDDNRAGIPRTLHRISAIRNRQGTVVGITCRVGRAVPGAIDVLRDLVEQGKSILLLGRPGVGKTTLLREVARVLATDCRKRVVVVDTSNEIGGDGDVPHPGIGRARRMQVPSPAMQHGVMIEAVENHMPEVIVIDEIGTSLEAEAARTIAERGVQLIGTAHGNALENLLQNPTLSDLIGGIQPVTLSDEEAMRRGTQKTVLERKAPPTFDVLVEMRTREEVAVHLDVAESVDALLRGIPAPVELRLRNADGTYVRRTEFTSAEAKDVMRNERSRLAPSGGVALPGESFGGRGAPTYRERRQDRYQRRQERRQERRDRRASRSSGWPAIDREDGTGYSRLLQLA